MKHSTPSRREILGSAAAAGALVVGPTFASPPRSEDDRPIPKAPEKKPIPADQPIRVGVIGTGGMGGGHLRSMMGQIEKKEENFQVVALCDVNEPRLRGAHETATTRQEGVEVGTYANYTELLARDDVDCVLIASPEHWHAKMSIDAIAAGKDVYCEKPMTLRLDEALWMYRTMAANPHMRLQVGTQYMMRSKYAEAKKLIADGVIGHPTFSQTSYCRNSKNGEWHYGLEDVEPGRGINWDAWCGPLGPRDWDPKVCFRWRRYKDFSTGIIGDLLVHMMTPMVYALDRGWPVRVSANGGHYVDKDMENHDQVNLTVDFEAEHTMVVAGSTCNEKGLETLIRGHRANLLLGSNNCVMQPERIWVDDIDERTINCPRVDEQPQLRMNWLQCVRSREENVSPVELATKVMVIVDLATRAMWEGGSYRFDPETMTASKA
ncbi:MAG: Gfo/Idh/MocA family oxidoreductase [bacterium]|nr:Gfo/Idh/MocA family oxidoreductase [bacterium]